LLVAGEPQWSDAGFADALKGAAEGVIVARHVPVTQQQLVDLLTAAPRNPEHPDCALLESVDFTGATFSGEAGFGGATFSGNASFGGARFSGDADFDSATFSGYADFTGATFSGDADFTGATLSGDAGFTGATFSGNAWFGSATFSGMADFILAKFSGMADFKATFNREASFWRARFREEADFGPAAFDSNAGFSEATFSGDADFRDATFSGDADFGGATFSGDAGFQGAMFERDAAFSMADMTHTFVFGPVLVLGALQFDGATFDAVELSASADRLSLRRARFHGPANVQLRWAEISLDQAVFESPSLLTQLEEFGSGEEEPTQLDEELATGIERFRGTERDRLVPICTGILAPVGDGPAGTPAEWQQTDLERRRTAHRTPAPRIVSLRGATIGNLAISGVDLQACWFDGAHGLDQLRLQTVQFAETPTGWQQWRGPVWIRHTRRQVIAEECKWRPGSSWSRPETQPPAWLTQPQTQPGQIGAIYRALRKGQEDIKDEPGAADLYYGEMEMRRQKSDVQNRHLAREVPRSERAIIWLYWLVSGYGLRASRALLALAITVALLGAIPLSLWGFRGGLS
jgi:hypothetical protein